MSKYSFEFKCKVVQAYLNGKGSYVCLATEYDMPSSLLKRWVQAYKEFGKKGLKRSRKKQIYSFEFKMNVVELYLTTEVSYQELALSLGLNNPPLIAKWVNDYRIAGPDALRAKKKGRGRKMDRPKDSKPSDRTAENENSAYIKQLEDELLKLRIENAYLKELRRLRLEEEALLKKQRESSTASEDSSN